MTTTLRSARRNRRTATFNLECLDDRIVLSAASAVAAAEAHLALAVSLGHTKAVEKATIILDRDEARLARHDAKHHIMTSSAVTNSNAASSSAVSPVTPNLAVTATTPAATTSTTTTTSAPALSGFSGPLPGNLSSQLQSVFNQFEASGGSSGSANFSPTGLSGLIISGNNVGIHFQTSNSDAFDKDFAQLESDGLQVSSDLPGFGIIEGMLPISALPFAAKMSASASMTPMV